MRLTLRTMLAYLDDILEPVDKHDVGKKIEESEFATGLMHRMRDVTRRLRVGAPKLHGRGLGLDANTVAEYLDNTLPSERVADFEKVCLESDVHLAEVASCHQILALVLGEPAEVETTSRQRLYAVINQIETRSGARSSRDERKVREAARRSARKKKKRRRPKVPEYLRAPAEHEPRSSRWAALLAAAVLLAATGIGLATYWPELSRRFQLAQRVEPPQNTVAVNGNGSEGGNTAAATADNTGKGETGNGDTVKGDTVKGDTLKGDAVDGDTGQRSAAARADDEDDGRSPRKGATNRVDGDAAQAGPNESIGDKSDAPAAAAGRTKPPSSRMPADTNRAGADASQAAVADEGPVGSANSPANKGRAKPAATNNRGNPPAAAEGIGRLISERDVLLRSVDDQWQRVPGRGTVYAGQWLVTLPTYRPSVAMSNGVTLQLLGGAIATLGATDDDGTAQIQLASGRLLLLTVAKPGTKVRLQAGDYLGTIEFGKEEAALAVEVRLLLPEGADPEKEPAPTEVDLYVASGEVTWIDAKGRGDTLRGRAHRSLHNPKSTGQADEELPVWIEEVELNPTERRASTELEPFLRPDKPVAPTLSELATHRKIEISMLATQSLALIDEFGPIVPLLNDVKYRVAWTPQIESLRAAIARSPNSAALLREAFEAVRGKRLGDQLYRMLWGYNSQQLEEGAAELIGWLDAPDDELDFRVLAYWTLHHITGLGLYYQPGDPEKQRRTSIQKWKQKLDSGLIVPKG